MLRISTFSDFLIFIPYREDCMDEYKSLIFFIGKFHGI